jgi:RNA polymerase sigma-70 factor, ECF subfamily
VAQHRRVGQGAGLALGRALGRAARAEPDGRTATEHHEPGMPADRGPLPEPREPADVQPTDAELLHRHIDGDPEAFGELFRRHRDRLWAVAVRTLGDPEEAADALQDAMISAFRRAGSFRGDSAVTTWLHRIVINASVDRLRRRAARPVTSAPDERVLDGLPAGRAHPDPSSASDTSLDVTAELRKLPRDQQAALVLVDMLGYSVADAAEILGVSQGTVKSRCARGRTRLLPRLAHLRKAAGGSPSHAADRAQRNRSAAENVLPGREGGDPS